jgi:hypothetical protein
LNDLVEDALKHNPNVQAAQAGLRVARETTEAQKGAYAPQISAGYNSFTQKASTIVSPPSSNPFTPYLTLHTAQVDVSYTPDVFGLVRREVETDEALAAVQQYTVEATYLTLTSNVVAGAIQEASLREQIAATKKIIAIETDLLRLLRVQKKLGQVAEADVALQEAALAQAEETLPPLDKQLTQQRDLLTALAGRYPSEEVAEKFPLESLRLPHELPVSLPSKLVEQRPDVQAASATLHSASASIGVAIAWWRLCSMVSPCTISKGRLKRPMIRPRRNTAARLSPHSKCRRHAARNPGRCAGDDGLGQGRGRGCQKPCHCAKTARAWTGLDQRCYQGRSSNSNSPQKWTNDQSDGSTPRTRWPDPCIDDNSHLAPRRSHSGK